MPRSTSTRFRFGSGIVAVGALLALTACAPETDPEPTADPAPETTAPVAYSGPALFVGDELNWFLLSSDEIASALPGSTEIGEPTSVLEQISDGGGPQPGPEICSTLFLEQSLWSVGSRNVTWTTTSDADYRFGQMLALQFADEAQAQGRMDQLVETAAQCSTFDYNGTATFESVIPAESDGVRALAGTLTLPDVEGGWSTFSAYAAVGNVLVQVSQSVEGDARPDAEAVATLLQDRATEAKASLVDELTANPPTAEPVPEVHASAPWGEWEIADDGVGPINIGDPIDVAVTAGQAAQVVEPEYAGAPWKLVNSDGTASLLLTATDDDSAVVSVTVGNDRSMEEVSQDGAALPARGGVRVGAPVADAIAAFPGGTTVTVVSSGDDWYDVATREGRLFRFHADRDVVEPGALIVGITVQDVTKRTLGSF
ncbi:sensor domain-containing protein [Microbacterium oxydans]|uniref:PknH-like extracellular domain-containing protein n=1 Tax=Microbacterium oxydans TaxID=82380 RepID=A0A0F0LJG7_9MICO|nr:sensor domain-containing protein [Microbacterium oxydans]KJL32819.1 hypothetical protein RS83_00191 [Microbacterium oxydans]